MYTPISFQKIQEVAIMTQVANYYALIIAAEVVIMDRKVHNQELGEQ